MTSSSSYSTTGVRYQELFGNDDSRSTTFSNVTTATPNSGSNSLTSAGSNQSGGSEDVDQRSDHRRYQVS